MSSDDEGARAAGHRHARLQQILREELDAIGRDELTDPRFDGIRFTSVELSVDYRNARVRFLVPRALKAGRDEHERLERALTHAGSFLRARLADAVDLKQAPNLRFVWDREAAEQPGGFDAGEAPPR